MSRVRRVRIWNKADLVDLLARTDDAISQTNDLPGLNLVLCDLRDALVEAHEIGAAPGFDRIARGEGAR